MLGCLGLCSACRCKEQAGEPLAVADLVRLVPESASFVLFIDFDALRKSSVAEAFDHARPNQAEPSQLGFEPTRDVNQAVIAAADSRNRPAGLEFVILLSGHLNKKQIQQAIQQAGPSFSASRLKGQTLYQPAYDDGLRLHLSAAGHLLTVVSEGWVERFVACYQGGGQAVIRGHSATSQAVRELIASSTAEAWLFSALSKDLADHLSDRLGWPEVAAMRRLRGTIAARKSLTLQVNIQFSAQHASGRLGRRLSTLTYAARQSRQTATSSLLARLVAKPMGRELRITLSLTPEQLKRVVNLLRNAAKALTAAPSD